MTNTIVEIGLMMGIGSMWIRGRAGDVVGGIGCILVLAAMVLQ